MPNSDVFLAHDSSLDDVGLLRRCERRIATFPKCTHDFSFESTDSTLSSISLTPSGTLLDGSDENKSDDSFITPTDKHNSTFFENTSVNRNPCQDNRRWAEHGNCRVVTHCTNLKHGSTSNDLVSKFPVYVQQKKQSFASGTPKCTATANLGRANNTHKTDITSSISSDSSPIVDNLILEPEMNLKGPSDKKCSQRRKVARCIQNETPTSKMTVSREASAHNYETRNHRSNVCRQQFSGRSFQCNKKILDPSSEAYLKKLDSILEKMSMNSDRQSTKASDKMARTVNTRELFSNYVYKHRKISPGRRSCNCPFRTLANGKVNLNGDANEVKRPGHVRIRTGTRHDMIKSENNLSMSRSATRTRCSRTEKRKSEGFTSACKDQARQPILPNISQEKSTSNSKKRSKSLSALPRSQLHEPTLSSIVPTKDSVKTNSCRTTGSSRKGSADVDSGCFSKRRMEILQHIPGDITPDEAGTLLKTVLSIIEQRHCMKNCPQDEEGPRKDHQSSTEWVPDVLSKYQTESLSDSCHSSSTFLSPKSKICYSDRLAETLVGVELVQTRRSPGSIYGSSPAEEHRQIENNSLRTESMRREPETPRVDVNIVKCEQSNTDKLPRAKSSDSASNLSDSSTRNSNPSSATTGPKTARKTEQVLKKSAVVLPYDDKFTTQSRHLLGEDGVQRDASDQILSNNVADNHETSSEDQDRQQRHLASASNTSSSAASRHIGWKCPLYTDRDSQVAASDAFKRGRDEHSPVADHAAIVKSESTLSDGFLYFKSSKNAKRTSQSSVSKKDCSFSDVLPGTSREARQDAGLHQHDGRNRLDTMLVNGSMIPTERRSSLLPCPHGSGQLNQTLSCQNSVNLDQNQELRDTHLDKVISDLRAQIRSTYHSPVDITHTDVNSMPTQINDDFSRAKFVLSHARNLQDRQDKLTQNETRVKGQYQNETTYLDNMSCSAGAVLPNTSLSNRLLGFNAEFPCINRHLWRPGPSLDNVRDLSSCPPLSFQNELQRNNQWTSSSTVQHRHGDVRPGTNMMSQFCNHEAKNLNQRERILAFPNEYQRPIFSAACETTGETSRDFSKGLALLPSTRMSNFISSVANSQSGNFKMHRESLCSEGDASNYHNIAYGCSLNQEISQVGHSCSRNDNILPVSFRNLDSFETGHQCGNLDAPTLENVNHVRSMESFSNEGPSSNVEPCSNVKTSSDVKPFSNVKIATTMQSSGRLELSKDIQPLISVEPSNNMKPSSNRQPGFLQIHNNFEAPKNVCSPAILKPHTKVESPINLKPQTKVGSPINLKPHTKVKSPINLKSHTTVESPRKCELPPCNDIDKATPIVEPMVEPLISPNIKTASRNPDLTQLKQNTESLLADVYRKYYADLFAPNMECARTATLTNSLEFLQNFSPISQVDVNTEYPLTIDTKQQLISTEIANNKQNKPGKSRVKISSKTTIIKLANQKRPTSTKIRETSRDSDKMESTFPNSDVQRQNTSKNSHRGINNKALRIQRSNSNNTGNRLYEKYEKPLRTDQSKSGKGRCSQTPADCLMHDITGAAVEGKGPIVLDVTSILNNDQCPVKENENKPGNEEINTNTQNLVVKTYDTRSAVPVNVKVISEINGRTVPRSENAKRAPKKASPRFQTSTAPWTPVVVCGSNESKWRNRGSVCPPEASTSDSCQSCTVTCFNCVDYSAARAARARLASSVYNVGRCVTSDTSLTSQSSDDVDRGSQDTSNCRDKGGNCGGDFNNSNSGYSQVGRIASLHRVKTPIMLLHDNESATANRPCAKILGELAFQLERRILDYVFGMEGSRRRRFYGYTVNNICLMMNKECKNMSGNDDPVRKSELAFRLKKLLIGLRKIGYDIKVHGDFAQQIVNTYGLLPCPPDTCTIEEFGLHNTSSILYLIEELASSEQESQNLQILLNSLKYLSQCDGRPLFVW